MKKLLTAYAISVYSVPATVFGIIYLLSSQEVDDSAAVSFIIPITMMLFVCTLVVANIVGAAIAVMRSTCLSFRTVLIFKLCLIPFYAVNFACWALASMVFHIALVTWPLIPFVIAYTYFTVAGTSIHNIAMLLTLLRDKKISPKQCVVHSILQLIFMVDVIDNVYLAVKQKRLEAEIVSDPN